MRTVATRIARIIKFTGRQFVSARQFVSVRQFVSAGVPVCAPVGVPIEARAQLTMDGGTVLKSEDICETAKRPSRHSQRRSVSKRTVIGMSGGQRSLSAETESIEQIDQLSDHLDKSYGSDEASMTAKSRRAKSPPNWREMLDLVREYRESHPAPVDTMV